MNLVFAQRWIKIKQDRYQSKKIKDMLLIPIRYERDCLRKAREAHLIHKSKTIEPLGINKRDEQ